MSKLRYLNLFKLFILTSFILFVSDLSAQNPSKKNAPTDYSLEQNWAALPTKKDKTDEVPKNSGLKDNQANAQVDVFFVHHTTYLTMLFMRNASLNNKHVNKTTDKYSMRNQASAFNGSCKIYAPRYRQASINSFMDPDGSGKKMIDIAYEDVKKAFEYYLANYNNGRPFIIAAHSQGSTHMFRLIKEYIDNNPKLYQQLVAAYLIGMSNQLTYDLIVPCDSASQTGCMNSWQTTRWGKLPSKSIANNQIFRPTNICTNPLSWTRNSSYVGKEKNLGGTPLKFNRIDKNVCDAQINKNLLWIHKPKKMGYKRYVLHYHLMDYNLFYLNIRENVQQRIDKYLRTHKN